MYLPAHLTTLIIIAFRLDRSARRGFGRSFNGLEDSRPKLVKAQCGHPASAGYPSAFLMNPNCPT